MAYVTVLAIHSLLRWVALGAVIARFGRALAARAGAFTPLDRRLGLAAMISLDLQLLLGLALYSGLSPAVTAAQMDMGAAMKDPYLRFWMVEHGTAMLVAIVLAHVGNIRVRKAVDDAAKHKSAAIFYGIVLVLLLVAMPWPFRAVIGRPLMPGF